MANKYAQQKALRVFINGICEACIVTDLSNEEEEYVMNLFYTCVNTSCEVKYGLKFTGIYKENIQVDTGNGLCIYKDEVRHIFTFPEVINMLLNPGLDYCFTKYEAFDIVETLKRDHNLECWYGIDNYSYCVFIRTKTPKDVAEASQLLKFYLPETIDNGDIHIGNNCVWFDKELTLVATKKTIEVELLDDDKVKKFKAEAAGAYYMHVWAGIL